MKKNFSFFLLFATLILSGPDLVRAEKEKEKKSFASSYPGTREGLQKLWEDLMEVEKLSTKDPKGSLLNYIEKMLSLKPEKADYEAVFQKESLARAQEHYAKFWNNVESSAKKIREKSDSEFKAPPAKPKRKVKVWSATTEQILSKAEEAKEFPGGYFRVVKHFQPKVTFYMVRLVEPGNQYGMRYDGFVYIQGRWKWFMKPWNVFPPEPEKK